MLINTCYGGFTFSKMACDMYAEKTHLTIDMHCVDLMTEIRYDPIMIDIVKTIGNEANGKYTSITIINVYEDLKDYITVDEYDGMESISYDVDKYIKDTITKIAYSTKSSDDKIEEIKNILKFKLH
jgi:hypothetical protein